MDAWCDLEYWNIGVLRIHLGVSKNRGGPLKVIHLFIGVFPEINHPFWGVFPRFLGNLNDTLDKGIDTFCCITTYPYA